MSDASFCHYCRLPVCLCSDSVYREAYQSGRVAVFTRSSTTPPDTLPGDDVWAFRRGVYDAENGRPAPV